MKSQNSLTAKVAKDFRKERKGLVLRHEPFANFACTVPSTRAISLRLCGKKTFRSRVNSNQKSKIINQKFKCYA